MGRDDKKYYLGDKNLPTGNAKLEYTTAQIRDLFSPVELAPKRRTLSLDEANRVLHGTGIAKI